MKYLLQFGLIATITFAAEIISILVPFPVPAGIYGLILMFLLLQFHIIRLDQVDRAGSFLLEIISVMFLPTAAGIINYSGYLQTNLVKITVISLTTCVLVLIVTAHVAQFLLRFSPNKPLPHNVQDDKQK